MFAGNCSAANLTKGKYYCFRKGDWATGLPCLVAGNDPTLQALARKDLARPTTATAQLAVADGWWDVREASASSVRGRIRLRAAQWGQILQNDVAAGVLKPVAVAPDNYRQPSILAYSAVLYQKLS